jgi:predicted helicase
MTSEIPDLAFYGSNAGQYFPRWRYEPIDGANKQTGMVVEDDDIVDGYRRIDNVTDTALARFRSAYGDTFTKDDIFVYVYGLLHSPDYRDRYAADLKKMLPRIPLVVDAEPYVRAGRALMDLHLGYETVEPYPLDGLDVKPAGPGSADLYEYFRVEKMAFAKRRDPATNKLVADRSTIVYNSRITLAGIPADAYRYTLGSRSAIEWIMDRYRVRTDTASGIVNDPNDWSREVSDPRYIIDLLARIVTVSMRTVEIVDGLPALDIRKDQ